jgi:hypothetical protein
MKKFIIAFLLISFFISCTKNDGQPVCGCTVVSPNLYDTNYKYADETGWRDFKGTDTLKNDTLTLHSINASRELIVKIPFQPGTTVVDKSVTNFTATYIRHATLQTQAQFFKLDNTANNTLTYSANTDGIGGRAELTFKLSNTTGEAATDTIKAYFPNTIFQFRLNK